ncbi:TonB-dependent receptor plug [Sporocytophaga myxococcoides]|uniref:TonB-dependent receptor plug n=1 Tax=Sporocytophaga myxococcoides TaxID=153721 RepID=A0A098LF28_9BACT|nr:TonB-dependent receptor plug domain-containing protein [Sporocytophaga myxococcoides]GAL85576.1 TonB-dependent receptor plug [Sporocytophaga myxococcoides]
MYFFYRPILFLLFITVSYQKLSAQVNANSISIKGHIKESSGNEPIVGVVVSIPAINLSTATDTSGFYSLSFESKDTLEVLFLMQGYTTQKKKVWNSQVIDVRLISDQHFLKEITILGEDTAYLSSNVQMSKITLSMKQVNSVPSLLGERDVIKVLQLMPGVQKGREGNTAMYVRGGGPDQNLIMLDGMPFYSASHLYGFFSLFNSDVLQDIEFTKGAFPAKYGGKLSSVLDMTMKEGNKKEYHGEVGVGILSSKLMLEGPIKKDKCSFIIGARRSYMDLLISPFLPDTSKVSYYFYDINAKVNWDINRRNKISFSFYNGKDNFKSNFKNYNFSNNTRLNWNNILGNLVWDNIISDKLSSRLSMGASKFYIKTKQYLFEDSTGYDYHYNSSIKDITLKYEFAYKPSEKHSINAGIQMIFHHFAPGAFIKESRGMITDKSDIPVKSQEMSIYVEETGRLSSFFSYNLGGRLTRYSVRNKVYIKPEPRVSMAFHLSKKFAIKTSYAEMNQYALMLSQNILGPPLDLWVPATNNITLQNSKQVALGIAKDFKHSLTLTIEGYYKKSFNLVDYKEGASFLVKNFNSSRYYTWEEQVTQGKGWTYGSEFMLHKRAGKFSGWLAYTLSWNWMQFKELNLGRKYPAKYDHRHDASVVVIYKPKDKFSISITWVYSSGNAYTIPTSITRTINPYPTNGAWTEYYYTIYAPKNSYRMPAYHRLDLGAQFHKSLKRNISRVWDISIYNAYNRENPYYYFLAKDGSTDAGIIKYSHYKLNKIVLFPIIPSVSYRLIF